MARRYTPKELAFLEKNASGRTYAELTAMFNKRFGAAKTIKQISALVLFHGFSGVLPGRLIYKPEEISFVKKNIKGRTYAEITDLFNERFGYNVSRSSIDRLIGNNGLRPGRDTRFKVGHVPSHKGKKLPGSRAGKPLPIGSERIYRGYLFVKTGIRTWKPQHVLIWEQANGKVPKGHIVLFADRNKRNFALDNLLLISRKELPVMNRCGLVSTHKELTKTGKLVADLKMAIAGQKRKLKKKRRKNYA
ncbi:MAG: HNH endonuclease [Treponema sp.]|jgi:hypothetical protein|nr:HNH endonuclease [Treponema sp.]